MAAQGLGPVIASDVTGEIDLKVSDSRYGERPLWWLLGQRMRGTPSIVSILMRSGTVGSEAQRLLVREQANFLFEPPLPKIGLRDWKLLDQAIAEGHAHARERIEQHGIPLADIWSDGPVVAMPQRAAE
jgi:NTE family protein